LPVKKVYDFGLQPISNRFRNPQDKSEYLCELSLVVDESTGLVTLENSVSISEIKSRYDWITCFEPEEHLDVVAERLGAIVLCEDFNIGGFSFKDDSLLYRLKKNRIKTWRIDPKSDLNLSPEEFGIESVQYVFPKTSSQNIVDKYGASNLFIVRHVIEHAYDLNGFIETILELVSDGGYVYFEIPDCKKMIDVGSIFMLWEEHTFYFTEFTFRSLMQNWGLEVVYYERFTYSLEDCLCFLVKKDKNETNRGKAFVDSNKLKEEVNSTINYGLKYEDNIEQAGKNLAFLSNSYATLSLIGVGHLSLNYLYNVPNVDLITNIVDDNVNKIGMKLPFGEQFIVKGSKISCGKEHCHLLGFNPSNHMNYIKKFSSDNNPCITSIFNI
jgi:hypothetical protein